MASVSLPPNPSSVYHLPLERLLSSPNMASQLPLPKSKQPLNPNAEPFYFLPRQLVFLPQHSRFEGYCGTGFYPPDTLEPSHVSGSIHWRISVSANKKRPCHRKFPVGHGRKRTTAAKRGKTQWMAKETKGKVPENTSTDGSASRRRILIPFPTTIQEAERSSITTIMIRNVPNQFKFNDLLLILDEYCFEQNKTVDDPADWSKFDFVYLPMDYRKHAIERRMSNLGYAFVNFTTARAAFDFYKRFQGFVWNVTENRKICEINAAQYQGKETLRRIFDQKVFRCESPDLLPVVFSEARDGFNRRMEGTPVGKHVWGLPRRSIGG